MQQEKTVKEWLEMLPEPYKSEALTMAAIYKTLGYKYTSLFDALSYGFVFNDSPQRHDYWVDVCDRAEKGEFDKPAIPWPEEAKWENAPDETFARAVDASGRCYFYYMAFMKTTSQHTTEVLFCGKISDMSNVQWKETLEYNPLLFKK